MTGSLREAGLIAGILASQGVHAVLIGAMALAAHRYVRSTFDVDLGIETEIVNMPALKDKLRANGYDALLREPDQDDPLGGVIDISGEFGLVQIVNFGERFPAAIRDSFSGEACLTQLEGGLRVMPIPQLVALKLYAGGWNSLADILELLRRNPEADLKRIGDTCSRYRLRGWEKVRHELENSSE